MSDLPSSTTFTARIDGNRTRLDRAVKALQPILECSTRQYDAGGDRGYREHVETICFHDRDRLGRLVFATGLLPRVQDELESLGCTVQIVDRRRFGKRYHADEDVIADAREEDQQLLATVMAEPQGQIEVRNHRDRLRYISLICRLYPRAQVIIPTARRRDAWKLRRDLDSKLLGRKIGIACGHRWETDCPILVCTYAVLATIACKDWQIALLPDVEQITGKGPRESINERLRSQRVYGFARPGIARKYPSQMIIEAMTGPVIYQAEENALPVQVLIAPSASSKIKNTKDPLQWKRRAYWRNDTRNDSIARVAHAMVDGDMEQVNKVSPALRQSLPDSKQAPRVVLLVESVEHGRQLHQRLPGWRFMTASPNVHPQPASKRSKPTGTILTQVRAAATRVPADIVIQASGGQVPIQMSGFPARTADKKGQAVVIDFADAGDRKASRVTDSRVREYRRAGWSVRHIHTSNTDGHGN